MKTARTLIILTAIILIGSTSAFARGGFGSVEDQVLRKVIAASEVVELDRRIFANNIASMLVDDALRLIPFRHGRDRGRGRGITIPIGDSGIEIGIGRGGDRRRDRDFGRDSEYIGSYSHPSYLDGEDGDADFRIPAGRNFQKFSFEMNGFIDVEYVLLFGVGGRTLRQIPINQRFTNGRFYFSLPPRIRPEMISTVRLHIDARKHSTIQAYGEGRGGGRPGNGLRAVAMLLRQVQGELRERFPNMNEIRRLLREAEGLLTRPF